DTGPGVQPHNLIAVFQNGASAVDNRLPVGAQFNMRAAAQQSAGQLQKSRKLFAAKPSSAFAHESNLHFVGEKLQDNLLRQVVAPLFKPMKICGCSCTGRDCLYENTKNLSGGGCPAYSGIVAVEGRCDRRRRSYRHPVVRQRYYSVDVSVYDV